MSSHLTTSFDARHVTGATHVLGARIEMGWIAMITANQILQVGHRVSREIGLCARALRVSRNHHLLLCVTSVPPHQCRKQNSMPLSCCWDATSAPSRNSFSSTLWSRRMATTRLPSCGRTQE